MFARSPPPEVSHPSWIAVVRVCGNVLQASGPPSRSLISVCERRKGGSREASLRSRQHYTRVPEGVVPTQLSLPLTCMHQLLPGSGSCRGLPLPPAWPCPGYPCLTRFVPFFFSRLFLSHNGRSQSIIISMEEAPFSFPCRHGCVPHVLSLGEGRS